MKQRMQLSLPKRQTPDKNAFDCRAQKLKKWIGELPIANIGDTTQALASTLSDINHQSLPSKTRLSALETLTPSIDFVTESLKKHFIEQPLPLTQKQYRVAQLTQEVILELATGYMIVFSEQLEANALLQKKSLLQISLYRAMLLLNNILLLSYQTYMNYPSRTWKDVHTLYWHAEQLGLQDKPTPGTATHDTTPTTISGLYKQITLLSLSCPYRLRRGIAEKVFMTLGRWQENCDILPIEAVSDPLFIADLGSVQPAHYQVLANTESAPEYQRALDTSQLAITVREALTTLRKTGRASEQLLNASTLRRLMLSWGVMPKRRYTRTKDHSDIITATGLGAIHYFISGEAAFSHPAGNGIRVNESASDILGQIYDNTARFRAHSTQSKSETPDMWEMQFTLEDESKPTSTEDAVARAAAGIRINRAYQTQEWKMVNVSAGGYCLLWDNKETVRAQVGELVGIRDESNPDSFQWRLGTIRWMKSQNNTDLELGIQMLSPSAIAITATPTTERKQAPASLRGLLLPEIASIQQQATVLLPSPPFRPGDQVHINCNGRSFSVQLTKLVENTGSFAQFQFTVTSEIEISEQAAQQPFEASSYNDIWDIL